MEAACHGAVQAFSKACCWLYLAQAQGFPTIGTGPTLVRGLTCKLCFAAPLATPLAESRRTSVGKCVDVVCRYLGVARLVRT